jgi:hypothetical protein
MFEDTKRAIRSRKSKIPKRQSEKSKKDRQYNGYKIPKGQSEESGFWLPFWYLLPLCCLSFFDFSDCPFDILDLRLLIAVLVS